MRVSEFVRASLTLGVILQVAMHASQCMGQEADDAARKLQMPDVDAEQIRLLQNHPANQLEKIVRPAVKIRKIAHVADLRIFAPALIRVQEPKQMRTHKLTIAIVQRGDQTRCQLTQVPEEFFKSQNEKNKEAVFASFALRATIDIASLKEHFEITERQSDKLQLAAKSDARRFISQIDTALQNLPEEDRARIPVLAKKIKVWQMSLEKSLIARDTMFSKVANNFFDPRQKTEYALQQLTAPLSHYNNFLKWPAERQYQLVDAAFVELRPIDLGQLTALTESQRAELGELLLEVHQQIHDDTFLTICDPGNCRAVFHVLAAKKKLEVIDEVQLILLEKLLRSQGHIDAIP